VWDNSLTGSIPNGVNNHSTDLPDYNGAPLMLNGNPREGLRFFNVGAFSDSPSARLIMPADVRSLVLAR
jgi:hypothetical protein